MSNSLGPHGLYCPWNSPGQNAGVGSLSLLQGIFPTQESNQGLLHCRWILYQLSCQGSQILHFIKSDKTFFYYDPIPTVGFPGSSADKESACNVGDPGLIPGLGRSTGKGIGPLQYFWASLVVQLVKNSPAMQETWV